MSDSFSSDGGQRLNADGTVSTVVRWTDAGGVLVADVDVAGSGLTDADPTTLAISVYPDASQIVLSVSGHTVLLYDSAGHSDFQLKSEHDYTPISLFFGWQGYGAPFADPAFWIDPFGICHLRGVAYLPAPVPGLPFEIGAVPKPADGTNEPFVVGGSGAAGSGVVVLEIVNDPGGSAAFLRYSLGDTATGAFAYLSGITYPT